MLDEAFELAKALAKNNPGWVYIPPFDDPLIWYVEPGGPWCRWHPPATPLGGHLPQCVSSHPWAQQLHVCVHALRHDSRCTHTCASARSPRPGVNV